MPQPVRAAAWLIVYVLLALAPLALSMIDLEPGRGFWVNASVALGFLGLSMLGLQFVLAARFVRIATTFGIDVVLQAHRQMTAVITIAVLAHPTVLMLWDTRYLELLNVFTAPVRAKFAVLSVVALLGLIATSLWRTKLGMSYQSWQLLHSALATLVTVAALVHVLLIGYYVDESWERGLWIAYSIAFLWIGAWVRVIRPALRFRRRWRITSVREQAGGRTVTLALQDPESYGPSGFQFRAGQFAWINIGRSPFSINYHPFSISSSAERRDEIAFTIKAESGFTADERNFEVGQTVYLDGPWGHFSIERHEGPGFVFLGGGVGITPLLSMLATMADRDDSRPCWVIVANRHEGHVIGQAELTELAERANVTIVHTLSAPGADWTGHRGHITVELLDELLPAHRRRLQYFICGPAPMMDGAEAALRSLGIPMEQVHSERFAMA